MSKYKVGDKFEIEIAQVIESVEAGGNTLYRIKGFNALVFDDHGLNKLRKLEPEEVDWSKVEVDTPILVKDCRDADWNGGCAVCPGHGKADGDRCKRITG